MGYSVEMWEYIDSLKAENQRLREALVALFNLPDSKGEPLSVARNKRWQPVFEQVRQALASTEGGGCE